MKKFFYFVVVAMVATFVFSCQNQTINTKTVVKTTVKEIGTEGFLIKKVIKGDTIWGYSEETYGTGVEWRSIVAENPFLSGPNRIYYDKERAKWIVIIYPGESIRIRGQVLTPTFISEEVTVTTTESTSGIPWWGWLLIATGGIICLYFLIGSIGLISYHRNCRPQPCCCIIPPTPTLPSVTYNSTASGDKRAHIEGSRETTVTHSASGELKITARQ